MQNLVGQVLKGYELRELIGAGGFGAVYRASQPAISREVAIKIILPEYANQPDFIRRFEAEAQLVARLEHIHIVPLYDYWRDPGGAYLVMRWLRGGSLRDLLSRGPLDFEATLRLLEQIAAALTTAHRNNVVHRDMKPDNILLDETQNAFLADFGIAKDLLGKANVSEDEEDTISGSPAYISPEQVAGGEITGRTDIYSLGVMIYELLAGEHPFKDLNTATLLFKHLREPIPSILTVRPDLPEMVDDILQRATSKIPDERYPDAIQLVRQLHAALLPVLQTNTNELQSSPQKTLVMSNMEAAPTLAEISSPLEIRNPYKGLRPFEEADTDDFYGRDTLSDQLLGRIEEVSQFGRFLAVIGPSGSGKSSVVKASVIPRLRRGALDGSDRWFIAEMLPGANPLKELEAALLRVAIKPEDDLLEALRQDENGLAQAVARILPPDDSQLLLYIDQFEEVFTLVEDEDERKHFLDSLLGALTEADSRLQVIVTLRADFYDRPLLYPAFGAMVRLRTEVVLPLSAEELESAIVQPAERVGISLEAGLVKAILSDVGQQAGALPLLQYALTELFERRTNHVLTLDAYVQSGGVFGALARRAEELYEHLYEDEQQAARQLFLRLVALGEGTEDTRRRVLQYELTSISGVGRAMQEVIELYGKYRLLTFDRDPETRNPTVEVAHEALIRQWTRLHQWLDESRDDLRLQRRLSLASAEWLNSHKDPSYLAMGARLQQFEDWLPTTALVLNESEREYISASLARRAEQAAREAERIAREEALEQRSRNRQRQLVIVLLIASIAAMALTALAVNRSQLAEVEASNAERSANEAQNLALASSAQLARSNQNSELALALVMEATQRDLPNVRRALYEVAYTAGMKRRLTGHEDVVQSVAYSPDGKRAVSASADDTLILWDVDTGDIIRRFEGGHRDWVNSVAISPDGTMVLSGSSDKSLVLWDIETGAVIRRFEGENGHTNTITSVAFSPDGTMALSGSLDRAMILWDVATGNVIRVFRERDTENISGIRSVAFSPSGSSVISGADNGVVTLWILQSGKVSRRLPLHDAQVYTVAVSPDGRYIASGSVDRTITVWDLREQNLLYLLNGHSDWVFSVAYRPDGEALVSASSDGAVMLWNMTDGRLIRRFNGHNGGVTSVNFSPDGRNLLSGGADDSVIVWDTEGGDILQHFRGHSNWVNSVAFSPDGKTALSASSDYTLRLWDAASGELLRVMQGGHTGEIWTVTYSPDGRFALSGGDDARIVLWDIATGEIVRTFQGHRDFINDLEFSPDGRTFLSASGDGTLILWDLESGRAIREYNTLAEGHNGAISSVAFMPDGRMALSGSYDNTLILWDVETGEVVRRFGGHSDEVYGVALSPDGRWALSASNDASVIVWDVDTGEIIHRLREHTTSVQSVVFSPDGLTAISSASDNSLIRWDVQRGTAISRFEGHTQPVSSVAISPDGKTALSGSYDNSLILWRVDSVDDLISWAYANRFVRELTCTEREQFRLTPACNQVALVPTRTPFATSLPTATVIQATVTPVENASLPTSTPTLLPMPTATATLIPPFAIIGENCGEVPLNDRAAWTYNGRAGENLRIEVYADNPANEFTLQARAERGLLDTILMIYAPDGSLLLEADDIRPGLTDSRVESLILPATGVYVLEVHSFGSQMSGAYSLIIRSLDD